MRALSMIFALSLLPACFDTPEAEVKDDTGSQDTAETGDTTPVGEALVSGNSVRTMDTCPPTGDLLGTLCVFLATDCEDIAGAAATAEVTDANMYWFDDYVDWEITGVADGSWQVWAFLDDDESGCSEMSNNDLYSQCQTVDVVDQVDVSGLTLELVSKCNG